MAHKIIQYSKGSINNSLGEGYIKYKNGLKTVTSAQIHKILSQGFDSICFDGKNNTIIKKQKQTRTGENSSSLSNNSKFVINTYIHKLLKINIVLQIR